MKTELTTRQKIFCREVARGTLASKAARKAGYKNERTESTRLMKRSHIREYIDHLCKEAIDASNADISKMIDELLQIAEQPSIGSFLTTADGETVWRDPSDLTPAQLNSLKATIPVRNVLNDWRIYEQHDRATALASLVSLAAPKLDTGKRQAIVAALTRIGKQRGFTDVELAILTDTLTEAA